MVTMLPPVGTGPIGGHTQETASPISGGVLSAPTPNAGYTDSYPDWGFNGLAWWTYVAPATGFVEIVSLVGDDVIALDAGSGAVLDYAGVWWRPVTAGQVVNIALGSYSDPPDEQAYLLRIGRVQPSIGPGSAGADNFSDAPELIAGDPSDVVTNQATREPGEPWLQPHGIETLSTAWWRWTAPRNGYAHLYQYGQEAAVYTGTSLDALTMVAWNGPNYSGGGSVGWIAEAGREYHVMVGGYGASTVALGKPHLTLSPYVKTVSPATSVTAINNSVGIVGGSGALSDSSLDSYVGSTSTSDPSAGGAFRLSFSPVAIPPERERIALRFVVMAQTDVPIDMYNQFLWARTLQFYGTSANGFGRSLRLSPLTSTPGMVGREVAVGYYDWTYEQVADAAGEVPLQLDMWYNDTVNTDGTPYKVFYAAWEIISWGEDEEASPMIPIPTIDPNLAAELKDIGQRFD